MAMKIKDTRPALGASEGRRIKRGCGEGLELRRRKRERLRRWLGFRHIDCYGGQISAASELTNTAIVAGRVLPVVRAILLLLMPGRLILTGSQLGVMHVLMRS